MNKDDEDTLFGAQPPPSDEIMRVVSNTRAVRVSIYIEEGVITQVGVKDIYSMVYMMPDLSKSGGNLAMLTPQLNAVRIRYFTSTEELKRAYKYVVKRVPEKYPTKKLIYNGIIGKDDVNQW